MFFWTLTLVWENVDITIAWVGIGIVAFWNLRTYLVRVVIDVAFFLIFLILVVNVIARNMIIHVFTQNELSTYWFLWNSIFLLVDRIYLYYWLESWSLKARQSRWVFPCILHILLVIYRSIDSKEKTISGSCNLLWFVCHH